MSTKTLQPGQVIAVISYGDPAVEIRSMTVLCATEQEYTDLQNAALTCCRTGLKCKQFTLAAEFPILAVLEKARA